MYYMDIVYPNSLTLYLDEVTKRRFIFCFNFQAPINHEIQERSLTNRKNCQKEKRQKYTCIQVINIF
jgi:hypothetical protein